MGALTHNGEVLQSLPANASQINFDKTGTDLNATQVENAIKEVNGKVNTNAEDITQLKSGLTGLNNIVKTVNKQPDMPSEDNIKRDILSIMSDAHAPYCVNIRYSGEDAMLVGTRMGNNYVSAIVIGIRSVSYYKYFGGAWTVTPIA